MAESSSGERWRGRSYVGAGQEDCLGRRAVKTTPASWSSGNGEISAGMGIVEGTDAVGWARSGEEICAGWRPAVTERNRRARARRRGAAMGLAAEQRHEDGDVVAGRSWDR